MNPFRILWAYIEAIREQTRATIEATAVAQRAINERAWERYMATREPIRFPQHDGHAGGNASIPGGCS